MKIYIASNILTSIRKDLSNLRILESYFYIKGRREFKNDDKIIDFFLDSGAFSAFTRDTKIDIDKYANFIKKHQEHLTVYANLDAIGDYKETQKNQEYLESIGLNPLPVFHYGEPMEIFLEMIKKYDYIALGGMVPISTNSLDIWLNDVWKHIVDEEGNAKIQIHGFGMTTLRLIQKYPWYSVDSTSPILGAAMGRIYTKYGELNLSQNAGEVNAARKKFVEMFFPKHTIEELKNDYKLRTVYNILYMQWLENKLTNTPPKFVKIQNSLF